MVTQPALLLAVTPPRNTLTLTKNRELNKQVRWRRKRERQGLDWQNNNFARASRFFVHFFNVAARLRSESA